MAWGVADGLGRRPCWPTRGLTWAHRPGRVEITGCFAGGLAGILLQEKTMKALLARLVKDEQGTETLEWGLVCGLIVVGAVAALVLIGPKVTKMWNDLNAKVP